MDANVVKQLEEIIRTRICAVCVDRNVDGTCDREAEGSCLLMAKIPVAAKAILSVDSNEIGPYIEALRNQVCAFCEHSDLDGRCAERETDRCMLDCYLPIFTEIVEEYFGRSTGKAIAIRPAQDLVAT